MFSIDNICTHKRVAKRLLQIYPLEKARRIFTISKKVLREEGMESESYNHLYIIGKVL